MTQIIGPSRGFRNWTFCIDCTNCANCTLGTNLL